MPIKSESTFGVRLLTTSLNIHAFDQSERLSGLLVPVPNVYYELNPFENVRGSAYNDVALGRPKTFL